MSKFNDLIDQTLELENIADMLMVGSTLLKWQNIKPNDEIKGMCLAFQRVVLYVNKLEMEKKGFELAISRVRKEKNDQIMEWRNRAELAEKALSSNPLNL